jgi:hypothetical protein
MGLDGFTGRENRDREELKGRSNPRPAALYIPLDGFADARDDGDGGILGLTFVMVGLVTTLRVFAGREPRSGCGCSPQGRA